MMKKHFHFRAGIAMAAAALVFGLSLAGCAATVELPVTKLPTMNISGIKRIAVMPFGTSNNSALQNEIASLITQTVISEFMQIPYYTVIDPSEMSRLEQRGQSLENHLDAQFIGQVISVNAKDSPRQEERTKTDPETDAKIKYYATVYDRQVDVVFSYNFKRTRDGSLVGVIIKQGSFTDTNEDIQKIKSVSQIAQSVVSEQLKEFARDVAPYVVYEKRTLMKEDSKDKELKNRMKEVQTIVEKEKNYQRALEEYLQIYDQWKNTAAGYNAGILYGAVGDLDSAIALLQNLYSGSSNPEVGSELARLKKAATDQGAVSKLYADAGSKSDKLSAQMVGIIKNALPPDAKVAVLNASENQADLAGAIADGITSGLMAQGVTLVDRNNTALVNAEKQYQMSGNVSDNDFVGIGNEAGVNTMVMVSITGASSLRRLQVRVLDVKTNTIIYQSPQSDDMNL